MAIALDVTLLSHLQWLNVAERVPTTLRAVLAGMRVLLPLLPHAELRASFGRLVRRGVLAQAGDKLWVKAEFLTTNPYGLYRFTHN
jgi:hypothetical protein